MNKNMLGFAGISALLIETASRDLSGLDNALFGLSGGAWSIICFASGVLVAMAGATYAAVWQK